MANKVPRSIRLTPTANRLLEALAQEMGLSQTAVIELAVRQMAKQQNITFAEEKREEAENG